MIKKGRKERTRLLKAGGWPTLFPASQRRGPWSVLFKVAGTGQRPAHPARGSPSSLSPHAAASLEARGGDEGGDYVGDEEVAATSNVWVNERSTASSGGNAQEMALLVSSSLHVVRGCRDDVLSVRRSP